MQLSLFHGNKVCFIKGCNTTVTAPYACLETLLFNERCNDVNFNVGGRKLQFYVKSL